jgi:hypothetical protein
VRDPPFRTTSATGSGDLSRGNIAMSEKRVFFISRAGADKRWAELIASVVRDAGHEAIYQDEHFRVGQSFIDNMTRAAESDCTIAVLSPAYFESEYCLSELDAALANDPLGRRGRVIPVRVQPVEIPSLLGQLAYLDLAGADDETARQRLMTALRKHGQVDATKLALAGRTRRDIEQANRNRSAMIEKVRTIWITGFLQQSLFHEVRILLGLSVRPDAVARPMDLLVKRPDEGERPLPSGTQVVDVFDATDQSLLILGAPGSGKTTLLLELARDLLDRAEHDPAHPIPVVFPLSTWAASRKPLVEWLQDELNLRYDVPRKIAEGWVATDQVLPLLDGLDEVKAERRDACVEAINDFRQSHGLLPLVITSRTADYEALAQPLRLHGAILARPLTPDQVNAYLYDLGPAGESVRAAICEDSSLWELLDSPLLLNIVTVACAGQAQAPPPMSGNVAERRDHLFGSYVNQMLRRRATERRYTPEQTVHWLSWLADQMADHGQIVFYLEGLQIDWLPQRQRWAIRACYELVVGLVVGLAFGLLVALQSGLWLGQITGLFSGLVQGLYFGLIAGLCSGLVASVVAGLVSGQEITRVETVRWSWSRIRNAWLLILTGVLGVGLVAGLVVGLLLDLPFGLGVGLVAGLVVGLLGVLRDGLSFGEIETRALPNEGIDRSARNAVVFGLGVWLAIVLVVVLVVVPFAPVRFEPFGLVGALLKLLYLEMLYGLPFGLFVGLYAGGDACLKHLVIRLWLLRNRSSPWYYVRFLDYAAERILLRKVGGGYAFIHRMLLDYFAARYVEPSSGEAQPAKPSSTRDELQTA